MNDSLFMLVNRWTAWLILEILFIEFSAHNGLTNWALCIHALKWSTYSVNVTNTTSALELGVISIGVNMHLTIKNMEWWKWSGMWPSVCVWHTHTHTRNLCSAFNPSKCTHTHHEHTPGAVDSQCCSARGAVGGSVPCSMVLKVERALYIHSPHRQFLSDLRLELTTSPTLYLLDHNCPLMFIIEFNKQL